MKHAVTVLR